MTNTTSPPFSPIQITVNTNESIGNTSIVAAIDRNYGILDDHFFKPLLGGEEQLKLLKDIRAVTNDPALQAELETRWRSEDSQQSKKINTLLQDVRYACLYLELARNAEEHKDRDRAWAFTCYASVMIGEITEKSAAIIKAIDAKKRSIQNSKNAQGRNKATLKVKEEVARLLEEKRPEEGWLSKRKVVTNLEEPLAEFIEKNNIPSLRISNIDRWLEDWLREDELVNPAWEKNKHVNA